MQTLWLILGSLVLPPVWGWIVHRLVAWLWPEKQPPGADQHAPQRSDRLADYQI